MAGELKGTPIERLAESEKRLARIERRLDARSDHARVATTMQVRTARTWGEKVLGAWGGDNYPAQQDGKGARLPIVFTDLIYDGAASDPVTLIARSATPQAWVYSPYGWIPRLIDIEVRWQSGHEQSGIWVVTSVPELEVFFVADVAHDASGLVQINRHGDANDQQFTAWFDHMAGSSSASTNQEAIVKLREGRKQWVVTNKEC